MSATRNRVPSGVSRTSWGMALAPGLSPAWGPCMCIASIGVVAPGVCTALRSTTLRIRVALRSTTRSLPLNSHVATKKDWSAEKSAWLRPSQGTCSDRFRAIVCGSRTSIRCSRSAITSAWAPSGVK